VQRADERELRGPATFDSAGASERVARARERQLARLDGTGARCNGEMEIRLVRRLVRLESDAADALGQAYTAGVLSARGRYRVARVARTIADLAGHDRVVRADLLLALSLRQRVGAEALLAA
jgi:magnesium chelatase family protein